MPTELVSYIDTAHNIVWKVLSHDAPDISLEREATGYGAHTQGFVSQPVILASAAGFGVAGKLWAYIRGLLCDSN